MWTDVTLWLRWSFSLCLYSLQFVPAINCGSWANAERVSRLQMLTRRVRSRRVKIVWAAFESRDRAPFHCGPLKKKITPSYQIYASNSFDKRPLTATHTNTHTPATYKTNGNLYRISLRNTLWNVEQIKRKTTPMEMGRPVKQALFILFAEGKKTDKNHHNKMDILFEEITRRKKAPQY